METQQRPPLDQDALLLGWQAEQDRDLGFHTGWQAANGSDELLTHADDSHLITFGPTGTGKGRSVIVPNLLNYRGTTVVIDLKNGELTKITARRRQQFGDVHIIDPFNVTEFPQAGLNPFDIFDWPNCQNVPDAEMLAEVFSQGNKGVKDPFWDQHGGGLLAACIAYVATLEPEQRTIGKVIDTLMSDDVVYNLAVLLDTIGKKLPRMAYREIASFLQMPEVTRGGVLATTQSYLKTFHSESVLQTFAETTFDLCDFIDGKPMTIYIVLPVDRLHSHRAILKLLVGVLLKAIQTRTSRPETRTLLLIDECGQLQSFPYLETFITLCRGFGCWAWTFWQDLAQLKTFYPTAWKTILNNCGVVQTFGFQNRDLAHQWSGYFDSHSEELRRLNSDEQVLLVPGKGEYRSRKLDYLNDAPFAGLFDENPLYHSGRSFRSLLEEHARRIKEAQLAAEAKAPKPKSRPRASTGTDSSSGGMQVR